MSAPIDLAKLITSASKDAILAKMLATAASLGLNTESWQPGDPTRTIFQSIAARWAEHEDPDAGDVISIIKGGLLGLASGNWLTNLAYYNYNTTRTDATFASCTLQLTNTTGADFGTIPAEDLTVENPHTSASPTYRNTAPFTLGPHAVTTVTIAAEVAGSGGNANIGDVDTVISPGMPGVTITNLTAPVGIDAETDDNLTARAQAKFESISPNGPRGAYFIAATTPALQTDGSGTTNVTRVRVVEDSDNGKALIYIAGDSGALQAADQTKALSAIQQWANPFCIAPLVVLAANNIIPVTYQLWVYDKINLSVAQIQTQVQNFLITAFKQRPIGGDSIVAGDNAGFIFADWVRAQIIEAVSPYAFKCSVTLPAADVALALSTNWQAPAADVAVLGTISPTITFVVSPK